MSIDPVVHAALIVVFAFLLKALAAAAGIHLGDDIFTALAGVIVTYILSLFGYALYVAATAKTALANTRSYKPPFTS